MMSEYSSVDAMDTSTVGGLELFPKWKVCLYFYWDMSEEVNRVFFDVDAGSHCIYLFTIYIDIELSNQWWTILEDNGQFLYRVWFALRTYLDTPETWSVPVVTE